LNLDFPNMKAKLMIIYRNLMSIFQNIVTSLAGDNNDH